MPFININDISMYYELHGSEDAPVLVLNNGVIMNAAASWVFQTEALSRHYRLLQYDCRGQGQSDHPDEAYTMEVHADDLAALLDGLDIESAHILGISYGGEVAQAFALKYPQMTKSLILADTVSEIRSDIKIIIGNWLDALHSGNPIAFFNATVPWNFSPTFIRSNPALLEDAKKRYANLDFPAVIRLCECFLEIDFTDQLSSIDILACIIVGARDILKGSEYATVLHQYLPGSELHIIPGAGHATCWEAPEEFNSIVLGFLAKQTD